MNNGFTRQNRTKTASFGSTRLALGVSSCHQIALVEVGCCQKMAVANIFLRSTHRCIQESPRFTQSVLLVHRLT